MMQKDLLKRMTNYATLLLLGLLVSNLNKVDSFSIQKCRPIGMDQTNSRRQIISSFIAIAGGASLASALPALADTSKSLPELLFVMKEARKQLDPIPALIKAEKWDAVRAILIQPPLSDCWAKGSKTLLPNYIEAVGNAGGDELAALEAREEAITHLRFLDMAVYNNVFNPIGSEGTSGATKELIRSYYEDPINEYLASAAALDELVQLGAL